jgi:hypothetical protein
MDPYYNILNEQVTPCINKGDDFNEWCRYYDSTSYSDQISNGYNVNSMGAKVVLDGKNGGCFTNSKSDESKARAICSQNYINEIKKLDRANDYINYNAFTKCLIINENKFIDECKNALNVTTPDKVLVTDIQSYDCNPGYGRAKCIFKNNNYIFNDDFYKENIYNNNSNINLYKNG